MSTVDVSVVIPYYNSDKYFEECLNSVLQQTVKPSEIIVVDDGSCAESRDWLGKFGNSCRIVTLPRNSGVAAARNAGIREARGTYIAFLDSDDKWDREKLAHQTQYFHNHPECGAVHTGVVVFYGEKTIAKYLDKPTPTTLSDLLLASHVTPSSLMIRGNVLRDVDGFDESFSSSEDYDLSIRIAAAGYVIEFINLPLSFLRREGHGNLSSSWKRGLKGHLKIVRKHRRLYREYLGPGAARRQAGRHLASAGERCGGLLGRLMRAIGYTLTV